jgi:hypothetical protein
MLGQAGGVRIAGPAGMGKGKYRRGVGGNIGGELEAELLQKRRRTQAGSLSTKFLLLSIRDRI